jgi:hypothetical protein
MFLLLGFPHCTFYLLARGCFSFVFLNGVWSLFLFSLCECIFVCCVILLTKATLAPSYTCISTDTTTLAIASE